MKNLSTTSFLDQARACASVCVQAGYLTNFCVKFVVVVVVVVIVVVVFIVVVVVVVVAVIGIHCRFTLICYEQETLKDSTLSHLPASILASTFCSMPFTVCVITNQMVFCVGHHPEERNLIKLEYW